MSTSNRPSATGKNAPSTYAEAAAWFMSRGACLAIYWGGPSMAGKRGSLSMPGGSVEVVLNVGPSVPDEELAVSLVGNMIAKLGPLANIRWVATPNA
jgi:hypothetical protein